MNSEKKIPRVVIAGGGITGLVAAYQIAQLSQKEEFPVEVLLAESSRKLGGVISSLEKNGCLLEEGPDSIFTEKPWSVNLCEKLEIQNEILGANKNSRSTFIALKNNLIPVPEGFFLLAPSKILPLAMTQLFSWAGKFRMLLDFFIPKKNISNANGEETVASFVLRRLGKEAYERMAQPMVTGIFSANPKEISLKAAFPAFLELEQKYGSVIKGLLAKNKEFKNQPPVQPKTDLFISFKNGMKMLTDKIADQLPENSVKLGLEINEIRVQKNSSGRKFSVIGKHYEIGADAVCLALPAFQSARILKLVDPGLSNYLNKIPYTSGISINLIYREKDIPKPLNGFGFLVPEIENKTINGCLFSSIKFIRRIHDGKIVLRPFIGGKQAENLMNADDKKIEFLVKKDMKEILKISASPILVLISRYPNSIPVYRLGHLDLMKKIEDRMKKTPGIILAGNGYYGSGVSECIHNGEESAEKLFNDLKISWKT